MFKGWIMRYIYLSDDFYNRHATHTEIMQKRGRPYACLAVQIQGVTFAIPMRHHITHSYCYRTIGDCGLDYTKAVVVEKEDIGQGTPQIAQAEFNIIKKHETVIINGMRKYVALYIKATERRSPFYDGIRKYSALQYFEDKIKR